MGFGLLIAVLQEKKLCENAVRPGVVLIQIERDLDLATSLIQRRGGG